MQYSFPFYTTGFAFFKCLFKLPCFCLVHAVFSVVTGSSSVLGVWSSAQAVSLKTPVCEEGHQSDAFWVHSGCVWYVFFAAQSPGALEWQKIKLHICPIITMFVCFFLAMSKCCLNVVHWCSHFAILIYTPMLDTRSKHQKRNENHIISFSFEIHIFLM